MLTRHCEVSWLKALHNQDQRPEESKSESVIQRPEESKSESVINLLDGPSMKNKRSVYMREANSQ